MLSEEVKTAYDNFYSNSDVAWRMLGAKYKAQNIVDVCKGLKPKKVLEVIKCEYRGQDISKLI